MLIYFEHDNYYTEIDMPSYLFKYLGNHTEISYVKILLESYFRKWKYDKEVGKTKLNFVNYLRGETIDFTDISFDTVTVF